MEQIKIIDAGPHHEERQIAGNLKKLTVCNTSPITTLFVSHIFIKHKKAKNISKPICCHGSRQGCEPMMFSLFTRHYSIGTDISPSAMFSGLVFEHDFHKRLPYELGMIYSNSYDQSNNPAKLFTEWIKNLEENGFLAVEYEKRSQGIEWATKLDPFGTSLEGLVTLMTNCARDCGVKANIYIAKHPDENKKEGYMVFLFKGDKSCNPTEFSQYYNKAINWVYQDKKGEMIPLYSPLDDERKSCLRSQIIAYSQAQVLQAASISHPNSFMIQCAERMRELLKIMLPSYSYKKLSDANSSQTYEEDLLTLLERTSKAE